MLSLKIIMRNFNCDLITKMSVEIFQTGQFRSLEVLVLQIQGHDLSLTAKTLTRDLESKTKTGLLAKVSRPRTRL